jgi:hypothetical protein
MTQHQSDATPDQPEDQPSTTSNRKGIGSAQKVSYCGCDTETLLQMNELEVNRLRSGIAILAGRIEGFGHANNWPEDEPLYEWVEYLRKELLCE